MNLGSFGIGLGGLNSATRSLERAAFEVARASTQRAGQPGTGDAADAPPPAAGAAVPPPPAGAGAAAPTAPPSSAAGPDVDLPRAMLDMISASQMFMANLQTIRRTDEALDALLEDR
jgi:hypothetical protein